MPVKAGTPCGSPNCCVPASDPNEIAVNVLVEHQRLDIKGCICGWSELGKSHARHQVAMLREAGLTVAATETNPPAVDHG